VSATTVHRAFARSKGPAVALAAILLLGAALRLHRLSETPAGLFCDEVAIAVNARALATTGHDLAGVRLPLYSRLRSYELSGIPGIVSQPIFQYASVPFALALGRTPLAVRLPAVAFGVLGIAATWLLGRALFGAATGLGAAALLAISPWHLHFSRVGFEAVSLPALLALCAWQLVTGTRRPRRLVAGAVLAALATYAYPPAQVFVPLLLVGFVAIYRRELRAQPRALALAVLALAVLEIPNLWTVATGANRARLGQTLITQASLGRERSVQWLAERREHSALAGAVLDDRRLLLPFVFAWSYASHLSPRFLFLEGDANPRHHPTRFGACPLFYAPLLLAGAVALVRRRREPASRLLLWWLATWPLPASLAVEAPHAIRAITALPALELAAALGLVTLAAPARGRAPAGTRILLRRLAAAAVAIAAVAETASFLRFYHGEYRVRSAPEWQAGLGPALREIARRRPEHARTFLPERLIGLHAFALFFGDIEPAALDPAEGPREQLAHMGYALAAPGERVTMQPGDLWLVREAERRQASWRELARFPYPDGTPNLYVVEWPGPAGAARGDADPAARGGRSSSANGSSAASIPSARAPAPGGPR
jgi:4-amino-4-deoxy-L-arabinose transferase-like glycosyltransferase